MYSKHYHINGKFQVLMYDIRSNRPLLVKDHNDGYAIRDLEFHKSSGMAVSMSSKIVKIWDKTTVRV